MSELWGFTSGARQRTMDDMNLRLADITAQKGELEIEGMMTSLSQNRAFLEALKTREVSPDQPQDAPSTLNSLAEIALSTGQVDKAKEYYSAASTIGNNQSLQQQRAFEERMKSLDLYSNLLQNVQSAEDWQRANATYELLSGKPSEYAGMEYSPEVVQRVQEATISSKDRVGMDLSEARRKASLQQVEESRTRQALIRAQTRLADARRGAVNKTDGSEVVPSRYVTEVSAELKRRMPDVSAIEGQARALSLPLAEMVHQKVRDDGLSMSEAIQIVLNEAEEDGTLGGFGGEFPLAGTASNPYDLPFTRKGMLDVEVLEKNRYYITDQDIPTLEIQRGDKLLWTGKSFKIVPAGEEDEEEDEE